MGIKGKWSLVIWERFGNEEVERRHLTSWKCKTCEMHHEHIPQKQKNAAQVKSFQNS